MALRLVLGSCVSASGPLLRQTGTTLAVEPKTASSALMSSGSDVRTDASPYLKALCATTATTASITSVVPVRPHSWPARRAVFSSSGIGLHCLSAWLSRACWGVPRQTCPITPVGTMS